MNRILFIGTTNLSYEVVSSILDESSLEIVGMITSEKNFKISYSLEKVHNYNYRDLSIFSRTKNIPVFEMNNGMSDPKLDTWIRKFEFDFILIAGWYHMIPKKWTSKYRCLGIHASLLPNYRGGAPLVWAIINGERETGVSMFLMDEGVDTGPVLCQTRVAISNNENIRTLMQKVTVESKKLCLQFLPKIDSLLGTERNRSEIGSWYPQRKPEDGKVLVPITTIQLSRFIRAQTRPYPGAYVENYDKKLYLWDCSIPKTSTSLANVGEVIAIEDHIGIQCTDGILPILNFSLVEGGEEIFDQEIIIKKLGV